MKTIINSETRKSTKYTFINGVLVLLIDAINFDTK